MLFLVATMIFGTSKIADAGKHLGRGIKEFKKEMRGDEPAAAAAPAVTHTQASSCASCGEALLPAARFCPACGHAVTADAPARACPNCHAPVTASARYCNDCGSAVGMTVAPQGA